MYTSVWKNFLHARYFSISSMLEEAGRDIYSPVPF